MNQKNIKDLTVVLSRTNYAERDRILTMLTPNYGKLSVLAKGVRTSKSKLAGGIELFAENEVVLIKGNGDLYVLTSSRMKQFWGDIAKDIEASTYAFECLKNVNKITRDEAGAEYYPYISELLNGLSSGKIDLLQIKIWSSLRLLNCLGVMPNLKTLASGEPIPAERKYQFDFDKQCFFVRPDGPYSQDHVKILRTFALLPKPVQINGCNPEIIGSSERLVDILLKEHIN